ncbi:SMC-Scp complex subunit ScpB [Rhodoblastus acidophilus]|uniref:SMC-Scp complex subunit ScpB n=1 Tax=Candidatus Rhodoblastus alkanivorans TaxID=2954117 RepID=A0ABS9Z252_9HYPH|nr:SMC-Scp complex subunit ScpB [Candidatus Rhodoblastus alkanivorans]MCI4679032.1 SMC-Scp complex subunit ScpB [Candidatus Rhodoblastus alkanivorans]MCI4681713.1 SMC-Scp complex subunit ScpB [Candidatus Rhodoblastus alkanivorans]MDI4642761.1 SMC-Scp complex subunit ScpB [Rhodoblastus acidophilus]
MARPQKRQWEARFDPELDDLPEGARWREWMGRVEAAIFASSAPVAREKLALLVGKSCKLDELIGDIADELRARPYELAFVAGGYQFRTKPRFAEAIRAARSGELRDAGLPELTPSEQLAVTAIAYLQPATRADLSRLAGKEISRDVIARLKRLGLIDGALRAPAPGAPFAYVTTKKFLEVFGLGTLRDLPDIERMEAEGLLQRPQADNELDGVLGLADDAGEGLEADDPEFDEAESEETADEA